MPMRLSGPIRGRGLSLTPFGMCRSTPSSSNSCSFCTYKITSHLHIPQLLKVPQFQRFAQESHLTSFVCADARIGEGGPPRRNINAPPSPEVTVFSAVYALPISTPLCFQQITNSGGRGGRNRAQGSGVLLLKRNIATLPLARARLADASFHPSGDSYLRLHGCPSLHIGLGACRSLPGPTRGDAA